jgi:hypothetical protein
MKGQVLFKGEIHVITKIKKMGLSHLKIFFSRTTMPILIRLGTNYPWRKGIQVSPNEGDSPSPRGKIAEE